ncbi:MAG: peptidoglycan DD-metalloendopeptidase family protein [Acidimicrobiales bacterium]|nr:peptidoglycan DD-metalloendopeptidase family protein [Acidimicrobiales bacterium]
MAAAAATGVPAMAQDPPVDPPLTPPIDVTVPVEPEPTTTTTAPPDPGTTTTTLPNPDDPTGGEGLAGEPVPVDAPVVPPRPGAPGAGGGQAAKLVRQQLDVARAEAVQLGSTYAAARVRVIELEAELDGLERSVTTMADTDRTAVRRVEAARRHFEGRAATATIRGNLDDFAQSVSAGSPNELAMANALLSSVLDADQSALDEYIAAREAADDDLISTADRLVAARKELALARASMVEARRANVSAQINLAIFAAGSDIVIHGFVFPVGRPHSFGDSFGAPRMFGTEYAHAHQGTDIMAPMGTPLMACERGVVSKMGTDSLGGMKLWLKGESGTFYYYAHLSAFAEGLVDGTVVQAGHVIGYVGDTGNAKGGAPHLHFEIHPDGGSAVNPYPLLKVVDELSRDAEAGAFG